MKINRVYVEKQERVQMITDGNQQMTSKTLKPRNVVDLTFQDINYSVERVNPQTQRLETKQLIQGLTGYCPDGQVTAILGSSGAGKTTLLNILACRVPQNRTSKLTGKIQANGLEYNYDSFSQFASYVMQNDVLLETMTPKEALNFVASLKYIDKEIQSQRVEETIKSMKLERCQNALIGGISIKGISGGERKRTSIGFELVSNPACILLDEPTSGLDSFTAFAIIFELKQLAQKQDRTIIFTIHSPSTDIFSLFDRIMLLVNGKFIFQGPQNEIVNHFASIGFTCPQKSNPMDYFLSLIHADKQINVNNFPLMFEHYDKNLKPKILEEIVAVEKKDLPLRVFETSTFHQLMVISARNLQGFQRDPMQLYIRLFQAIAQGLLLGGVFWDIGESGGTVSDLFGISGSLFFCVVNLMISSILSIILSFATEREVFLREENSKLYSLFSYFIGKQILEIPLSIVLPIVQEVIAYYMCSYNKTSEAVIMHLFTSILIYNFASSLGTLFGCIFHDLKALLGIAPYAAMPYILFSGYFANPKYFYSWDRWLQYVSPITYSFELISRIEYKDQIYDIDPIALFDFQFGTWTCVYVLIGFIIAFRAIALFALYILKSKLQ